METITKFTKAGADEMSATLTTEDATESDAWTYTTKAGNGFFMVAIFDEDGYFVGYL